MPAPLLENLLDPLLLPEILLADEVDLQPRLCSERFDMCLEAFGSRAGPLDEIENLDTPRGQVPRHTVGIAKHPDPSLQNQPVDTRQHASNFISVSFHQFHHRHDGYTIREKLALTLHTGSILLGSGLSGLGSGANERL